MGSLQQRRPRAEKGPVLSSTSGLGPNQPPTCGLRGFWELPTWLSLPWTLPCSRMGKLGLLGWKESGVPGLVRTGESRETVTLKGEVLGYLPVWPSWLDSSLAPTPPHCRSWHPSLQQMARVAPSLAQPGSLVDIGIFGISSPSGGTRVSGKLHVSSGSAVPICKNMRLLVPASEPGICQTWSGCPASTPGLRASRSETTVIWPEHQLRQCDCPQSHQPIHPVCQGGTALAGVGNGQVGESICP